jgi:hypothetical protein
MSVTGARGPFAGLRCRPVSLSSPHPAEECLRRLAAVTTARGSTWYLDARTAGKPDPRFRGTVTPRWIRVARFSQAIGRNSFVPWLQGCLQAESGGGTSFTGQVGPDQAARVVLGVITGMFGVFSLISLAADVSMAKAGDLGGHLAFALIPLALDAFLVGMIVAAKRSVRQEIPRLIQAVNEVLDSTVTSQAAAGVSSGK